MRTIARQSAGSTLVELILVMLVSSSLMGVLVTLVSRVIRTNATSGEHLEDSIVLGQMSEQFRNDVHEAIQVSLGEKIPAAERLSLQMADGSRIDYELAEGGLKRTLIVTDEKTQSETFVLHGMRILGWEQNAPNAREVSMLIDSVDVNGQSSQRPPIEITAAIVRDRRSTGPPQ